MARKNPRNTDATEAMLRVDAVPPLAVKSCMIGEKGDYLLTGSRRNRYTMVPMRIGSQRP